MVNRQSVSPHLEIRIMLLNVTLYDNRNASRGSVRLRLDFATKQWSIPGGSQQAWAGVGYTNSAEGAFEVRVNGAIWLWDQRPGEHNTIIIWDAPTGDSDFTHDKGQGLIFDPKDPSLKDGRIIWTLDPSSVSSAPIRARVLELIKGIPFDFPPVYKVNFPSGPPNNRPDVYNGKVTNCGEFPGWITKNLGGSGAPSEVSFKFHDKGRGHSLAAPMTAWETWAKMFQSKRGSTAEPIWIPYGQTARPKSGDIYVLY